MLLVDKEIPTKVKKMHWRQSMRELTKSRELEVLRSDNKKTDTFSPRASGWLVYLPSMQTTYFGTLLQNQFYEATVMISQRRRRRKEAYDSTLIVTVMGFIFPTSDLKFVSIDERWAKIHLPQPNW